MMWAYVLAGGLAGGLASAAADALMARRAGEHVGRDWWRAWAGRDSPARRQALILAAAGALLLGYLWQMVGPSPRLAILTGYVWLLLLIVVIDVRQRLVYNGVLVAAGATALAGSLLVPPPGLAGALAGGVTGVALLGAAALVYPRGMGAGDVKLAGVIGLMTGFPGVVVALVFAILAGGLTVLALLAAGVVRCKTYIPYTPFLAVGGIVALIHGPDILAWYLSRLGG